jgi:hypothetical protein
LPLPLPPDLPPFAALPLGCFCCACLAAGCLSAAAAANGLAVKDLLVLRPRPDRGRSKLRPKISGCTMAERAPRRPHALDALASICSMASKLGEGFCEMNRAVVHLCGCFSPHPWPCTQVSALLSGCKRFHPLATLQSAASQACIDELNPEQHTQSTCSLPAVGHGKQFNRRQRARCPCAYHHTNVALFN